MRTRQFNVSVPADKLSVLELFNQKCKQIGMSRSQALIILMEEKPLPVKPVLPDWLK